MYIKQIIVQGFKSYKDQTIIEPFSPGTNIIVGRNGSGKSNFFAAIQFVLSHAKSNLSREERVALLHEGSGAAVNIAYVEVIFDNKDRRFATDKDEVAIRRTIGHKKDEYSLDKKVLTKKELFQILETAGFSTQNPYYIVPQGHVTHLTNMKEGDRLNLLKGIAGTSVYESRLSDSQTIMMEANNNKEKIDELLDYIKERLSELEEEKNELREFQSCDRERRCLEYAFWHQRQRALEDELEKIEEARRGGGEMAERQQEAADCDKVISDLNTRLEALQQKHALLQIERRQLEEDRDKKAREAAKHELKVKDLADSQSARDQAKQQYEAELGAVQKEIKSKRAELKKLLPEYGKRKQEEEQIQGALDTAEDRKERLLDKKGRGAQFQNRAERDAWLQKEIDELTTSLGEQKANLMDAEEEVKRNMESIERLGVSIEELETQRDNWGGGRQAMNDQVMQAIALKDQLDEDRTRLRREEEKLKAVLSTVEKRKDRAEVELSHAMDRHTSMGLAFIRQLKRKKDIPGAYGTLAELMEVPDQYRTAVEQTAGTGLFHYVVDNETTARLLLQELQKAEAGRVTCMPLSQLRPRRVNMPRATSIVPLISKIKYSSTYEDAFQQVFGKTVVTEDLTIGGQYARSHNVDAITIDGDIINKRGVISGGYIDSRRSRLQAVHAANQCRDEYNETLAKIEDIRKQLQRKDQEITGALGEAQKAEQRLHRAEAGLDPLMNQLRNKRTELDTLKRRLEDATNRRDEVDKNMKKFGSDLEAREAEITSDFRKALTSQEEEQLGHLANQIQNLRKKRNQAHKTLQELESRKQVLERDLGKNLPLKEDFLRKQVFEDSAADEGDASYANAQKLLKKLDKSAAKIKEKLEQKEAEAEELQSQISEMESTKASKDQDLQELNRSIEKLQRRLDKSQQRRNRIMSGIEECTQSIRDLGVLPDEAFGKYEKMRLEKIESSLKRVNEKLKKYKHVNKKAFEQYSSFITQQEQLLKRRQELEVSQESINKLIKHLGERKDEAVERTFKQVSKNFAEIFEQLVPAGHGRLVIQRRADKARQRQPDDSDEEELRNSIDNYTGVGISVSFNSKVADEQQKIQQLSGGQKSLCALCLIFAIQRTETSPFVIFDEVDANLDAQYRTAVADLMQQLSREGNGEGEEQTQFICTTFRPELVHVADKVYGVTFRNKSSAIGCYDRKDALEFVEGEAPR